MSKKQNPKPTNADSIRSANKAAHDRKVSKSYVEIERESREGISKAAQDYWDFLSNPFDNKPSRPVFYDGTYIGSTGLVTGRVKGALTVGTGGCGWVMMTMDRGPSSKAEDSPVSFTTVTYTGGIGTEFNTGHVGVQGGVMPDVPYTSTETRTDLLWRPVGGALRITPRGSMTNQDGVMMMIEIPGHASQFGNTSFESNSFNSLVSHPRSRIIRAAQLGDPGVVNQLNWHPQAAENSAATNHGYANEMTSDIKFRGFNPNNTTRQFGDCIIAVDATAGLTFEFEFIGVWETKGAKATGLRPSIQDAHASAIIFNTLCRLKVSGLVGRPHEFTQNYHVALHETARKTVAHARNWVEVGKEIASLVKEVVGFVL